MRTLITAVAVLATLGATRPAGAATPFRITGALVAARDHRIVSVSFSDPVTREGPHTDKATIHVDGAPGVVVAEVGLPDLDPVTFVTLTLSGPLPPGEIKVCFRRISYVRDDVTTTTTAESCAAVSADIKTAQDAALKILTDTPVAPDEMAVNASGFVTAGDNGTEGGADLVFNPKLRDPHATAFFRLKKATSEDGDARHFEVGAAYKIGIPWRPSELRAIREAPDLQTMNDLVSRRQRNLIAGTVVKLAFKLEGEPTGFDATNGVGEADYQIHTMTRRLAGRQGFWRGYLVPGGVEIGRKLGVDEAGSPTEDHDWIARYKASGGIKFFYQAAPESTFLIRGVDFDLNGTWRYLGVEELNFNKDTEKIDRTTDGAHGYLEVAVKVFFSETSSGRFGIKASYNRGSLPPVFAPVDSFQFGFVMESNDGK